MLWLIWLCVGGTEKKVAVVEEIIEEAVVAEYDQNLGDRGNPYPTAVLDSPGACGETDEAVKGTGVSGSQSGTVWCKLQCDTHVGGTMLCTCLICTKKITGWPFAPKSYAPLSWSI